MPNYVIPNPATARDLENILAAIVGNFPITPPAVSAVSANPGSTTYTYCVVAKMYGLVFPVYLTITTGASALSVANQNTVTWSAFVPPIPAPSTAMSAVLYDVYRTAGGTTQGKILSNLSPLQLGPLNATQLAAAGAGGNLPGGITFNSGSFNPLQVVDNGIAADGSSAPPFSTFGLLQTGVNEAIQEISAAGPITIPSGLVVVLGNSALALTLNQPVVGLPSAGGQDGCVLTIIELGTGAHTVTTATNGINPSHHILTFGGAALDAIKLFAYNGLWYVLPASSGVTPS